MDTIKFSIAINLFIIACLGSTAQVSNSSLLHHTVDDTIQHTVDVPFIPVLKSLGADEQPHTLSSPNGMVLLRINIAKDQIQYEADFGASPLIQPSVLDLTMGSMGSLASGLILKEVQRHSVDEVLSLPIGEKSSYRKYYNEAIFSLTNSKGVSFELVFRAFNEGLAFRYIFPESESLSSLSISAEATQFNFARHFTAYVEPYNERFFTKASTLSGFSRTLIPLTLISDEVSVSINESDNDNYTRIGLRGHGNNRLQSFFLSSSKKHTLPFDCPWRYLVIASTPEDLFQNKEMLYGLSPDDADGQSWDWVKPGKVFRSWELTTEGGIASIDFCKEMNMQYMMFDAGWYGLGYGESKEKDPRSNPLDVIDAIDMEAVCSYADRQGIGVILYINKVGWNHYNNQTMFDLYESWGVKGLKLGFMDGYSATGTQQVYDITKEAARRKMVVNVHDEFRFTGATFQYPNLLTVEGIRGNEWTANTGDHTTLLPFTRFLAGAADYTICYKGNDPNYNRPKVLGTTRGHQLALSVMYYSPLQHLFWYAVPGIYHVPVEVEFFKEVPVVWDDFKVPAARMGDFVSMARRKGDTWYLGTIADNSARNVSVPLNFLDAGKAYDVTIYRDAMGGTIVKEQTSLDELLGSNRLTGEGLQMALTASGGQVCIFKPATTSNIIKNKADFSFKAVPNPSNGVIRVMSKDMVHQASITVLSLDGRKVYENNNVLPGNDSMIDLSAKPAGYYLVMINANGRIETHKILKK
ncbi:MULTISPECIES: glycoside hydrolase family 97 catalytic domain-containing protein [unclassified Carboxylicivirga]|uniref:glycoside hydrolase family 97 catalytic domain-containing protein n=1 Tax=Carboxylicivirga TaxID=1628153 RepID=UPI003D33E3F5